LDRIASIVVASFAAPLLALLSLRLFHHRRLAAATGIAAAVHPPFLLFTSDLQTETLFLPLLLAAGAFLLAAVDRPSMGLAFASGVALGVASLTRPSALALAPLLVAPLCDKRLLPRARRSLAAAAILAFVLALAPWTIRNFVRFGEFIPVSDEGGSTFFDGNSDWAIKRYQLADRGRVAPLEIQMTQDKYYRLARMGILPGTKPFESPSKRSLALVQTALEDRRRDPSGTALLYARKIWHWIRPYPMLFWDAPTVVAATLLYTSLYIAAAIGLKTARRRGAVWFSVAVLAISMAVHVALLVLWRYRVSYWDPVLLLFGVPGAAIWLSARRGGAAAQAGAR
jgi:Dolichyl-phosphate-mannose-protein mannosyltransferase